MTGTITFAPVRKVIEVKAPQAHAFEVFATGAWWPKTHSVLASRAKQQEIVIEPRVGGRWFERGEDGSECDWGRVIAWEPPRRLVLTWQIDGNFQYDKSVMTEVEVKFIAESAALTRVELEHRHLEGAGGTAAALRATVDSPNGWTLVLARFAEQAAT